MGSLSILRTVEGSSVEVLVLDAVISERVHLSSEITEHALEDGSTIADHKIQSPDEITITGWVSNYPIVVLAVGVRPARDDDRSNTAYVALRDLLRGTERVTIQDTLDSHTDMVLVDLDIPRDLLTYTGLQFTAQFRKVRLVATQVVELSAADTPIAKATEDKGVTTPQPPTDEETNSADSILYRLGTVDSVGGALSVITGGVL